MGSVRLYGSTSGYLELQAPAVAPDAALVLPSDSLQPGLVHLHTETFTAKSSVSIDDVFSSEYENYRLIMDTNQTAAGEIYGRFRSGGVTDTTTANYLNQWVDIYSTTVDSARQTSPTGILFAYRNGSGTAYSESTIYQPNVSATTKVFTNAVGAKSNWTIQTRVSSHTSGVQDGIEIIPNTGTLDGTLRIYGYRNS